MANACGPAANTERRARIFSPGEEDESFKQPQRFFIYTRSETTWNCFFFNAVQQSIPLPVNNKYRLTAVSFDDNNNNYNKIALTENNCFFCLHRNSKPQSIRALVRHCVQYKTYKYEITIIWTVHFRACKRALKVSICGRRESRFFLLYNI